MLIALAFIAFIAMIASWLMVPEKSAEVAKPAMAPMTAAAAAD
jgi:hypothetical protein